MTDTPHTPTPWTIERDDLVPERGAVYIAGPDGWSTQAICDCEYSQEGIERDEANAALIVRAVNSHDDLVKALELAADTIRGYDGGDPEHETGWANDELCVAWVACRDALQKARS